jgi:hypothetical protein
MMLKNISRTHWMAAWVAGVIAMMAGSVAAGASLTISTGELWLVAGIVPPAVIWLLWRGAPPLTVAEVLYTVNGPSK